MKERKPSESEDLCNKAMAGCRPCSDVKSGVACCQRQFNGAVDVAVNVNQEGKCSSKK